MEMRLNKKTNQTSTSQKTKTIVSQKVLLILVILFGLIGALSIYMVLQSSDEESEITPVFITSQVKE